MFCADLPIGRVVTPSTSQRAIQILVGLDVEQLYSTHAGNLSSELHLI